MLVEKKIIEWDDSEESKSPLNIYFEKFLNPLYKSIKKSIKINKFYNIKEETTFDDSYDNIFDALMDLILKKLK